MATVVKQVLEEVHNSTVAQDNHKSTTPDVADVSEGDGAKEPGDGAGEEQPDDQFTCCALKCEERFTSPDALRYSFDSLSQSGFPSVGVRP